MWSVPLRVSCPGPFLRLARLGGGAVRSQFPPTWLGIVEVAVGRPRGGCLLLLRGASGVRRSPSPDCPPTGLAVEVRYPRVVGAGVRVWGPFSAPSACTPCGGCAPRGRSVAFVCRGAGLGGGGVRRTPRLCGQGRACRAGGRSASFRASAFPGQATKRVSLASRCPWGALRPLPLRFVLARLLWARSARRPGALARARLFSAVPVGAGGWGGGGQVALGPLSRAGGGTIFPASGGGGRGPRGLRAGGGGGGWGDRAAASLLPFWVAACGTQSWPPSCRRRTPFRRARAVGAAVPPRGGGGLRGGPWTAPPGAPADLKPPFCPPLVGCGHGWVM